MKSLSDFTNVYSLSKTLRFELRPVNETGDRLEEFKNAGLRAIVEQDRQRAADYKAIKKIIDDYHRDFIEEVLSSALLTEDEIKNAYSAYSLTVSNRPEEDSKKVYSKIQEELRKKIAKSFEIKSKEYHLYKGEFSKLINTQGSGKKKTKGRLWLWLKEKLDKGVILESDFNAASEYIDNFDKFTTYFTGFNQNRNNLYVADEKSTAIGYRIVHENMERHFENCRRYERIEEKYPELGTALAKYKESFLPGSFTKYLSQKYISEYNEAIGHKSDDINAKGINQLINEYRQQNNIKPRELPVMAVLYKQLLSDIESTFVIDEFHEDTEVFSALKELHEFLLENDVINKISELLKEYIVQENLETIYLCNDLSLTNISNVLLGHWSNIGNYINSYAQEVLNCNTKQIEKLGKEEYYSIAFIQQAIDHYYQSLEDRPAIPQIAEYIIAMKNSDKKLSDEITSSYSQLRGILGASEINTDRRLPSKDLPDGGEGFQQIEKIKNYLESIMSLQKHIKPLFMMKGGKMLELGEKNSDFYDPFNKVYEQLTTTIVLYNKVRNYVSKKPYKTDKFKINFANGTLLDGWDVNKEVANNCVLLFKSGKYYLGIMQKQSNNLFNYISDPKDSKAKAREKDIVRNAALADVTDDYYEKMVYKLLPDPSKMLPKVFFSKKNIDTFNPSQEILDIREGGSFKKEAQNPAAKNKWIDFMKSSLATHPEWNQYFSFNFRETADYTDISEFYKDVAEQGYSLSFDKIKSCYVEEKISSGELYLFEIYSKDFSSYSKGRPNLHTSYWKLLFSKENLQDLVIKLNGQAEIFFRPASLKKDKVSVHKANNPVKNKNPLNQKKESVFDYDIYKDKRYTQDKFFFHCPITLNFKQGGFGKFNDRVNMFLKGNSDVHLIGIDRGERHLLYYTVINQKGVIVEQGSLNTISNSLISNGKEVEKNTNYHRLLDQKEKERDAARKSWSSIENIKELKSGYLSHVVHKLAMLMEKYNAVIVLEDLNFGFKRGRFKFEKQVYQKFEKALIDKLNYLVFKDKQFSEAGHYLKAYQLTAPFESFKKLGKQSGFLFYVTSDYTSKIDPVTGFASRLYTKYQSVEKSREFFNKFNSVRYNSEKQYFEFTFDYSNFRANDSGAWTVCTHGDKRYRFDKASNDYKYYNVTNELKDLFNKYKINFSSGDNIRSEICALSDKSFFSSLIFYLSLTVQLRHTYKEGNIEKDFILSPVADINGKFFDSREYEKMDNPPLPANADANGAYNIARKGILTLRQIDDSGRPSAISNAEWFRFVEGGCGL